MVISAQRRDIKWFLPGLASIGGLKYYSGLKRQSLMKEQGVDDYWRKSRKLNYDLRKVEHCLETRKLFEKGAKQIDI